MKEFLDQIDKRISENQTNQTNAKASFDANRAHLEAVICRLRPLASDYKTALKERSIDCIVQATATSITFEMQYKDGGHRKLFICGDLETNRVKISEYFTNDDGKNYTATDGSTYDEKSWKDEIYTKKLESCIKDFISYADRHGGYCPSLPSVPI